MQTRSSGRVAELVPDRRPIGERGRVEAGDVPGEVEVLARPVSDQRQLGPEAVVHDILEVPDEEGTVAQPRIAGDVLDHLGVVVGRHERLSFAAVGHRQPADEVRQPDVRRPLLLGVLVQVVVELPGLVPDPEVVLVVTDDVVEDHEVVQQDLVHPPDRLEAVEVVLGALALDVVRLVREKRACRMDPLAARLEHRGHRMLGEPVDLEVGMQLPQLRRDRGVALRVAEPDRRRDVERALAPRLAAHPARRTRPADCELAQQQVDLDRITCVRQVARALEQDELAAGELREPAHRTPTGGSRRRCRGSRARGSRCATKSSRTPLLVGETRRELRRDQRLGVRLETPADRVLASASSSAAR